MCVAVFVCCLLCVWCCCPVPWPPPVLDPLPWTVLFASVDQYLRTTVDSSTQPTPMEIGAVMSTCAWFAWSAAAERALVDAFCLAGGPILEKGFCLGRGLARFNRVRLGGPKVRKARARCSDPGDGALVDLYRDCSIAPLVDLRRRLRAVLDVIAAIGRSGFTVSRGLELTRQ